MPQCQIKLNWRIPLVWILGSLFTQSLGWAQQPTHDQSAASNISPHHRAEIQPKELDLEIDGLVVDQTLTKSGRDFYELFYNQWQPPNGARNFTLLIQEQPSRGPGMGTQINIIINDYNVVSIPLQPRYAIIEKYAGRAVGIAVNYLVNYQQIQRDLEGPDKMGNGIY